jgi:HSP20 family molecular chaperone IbpA
MGESVRSVSEKNTLELRERSHEYLLVARFPGLRAEDLALDVESNVLTIRGIKHMHREHGGLERRDESAITFARSIQLPQNVDTSRIQADFGDGTLEVHIPKTFGLAEDTTSKERTAMEPELTSENDEAAADRSLPPPVGPSLGRTEE